VGSTIAERSANLYDVNASTHNYRKRFGMKNPLDSLGQTVLIGFILAAVAHLLIRAIA
jgi:ABC-type spermidine/putrescine transport system permease subunit II